MECKWKDWFCLPERKFSRENGTSWKVDQNSQTEFLNGKYAFHLLILQVLGRLAWIAFDPTFREKFVVMERARPRGNFYSGFDVFHLSQLSTNRFLRVKGKQPVFHRLSKHLEFRQKYSAARRIFNSSLGVWKSRWKPVSRVWYITSKAIHLHNILPSPTNFEVVRPLSVVPCFSCFHFDNCPWFRIWFHLLEIHRVLLPGFFSSLLLSENRVTINDNNNIMFWQEKNLVYKLLMRKINET